jgi:opacity protein-like surface antigen
MKTPVLFLTLLSLACLLFPARADAGGLGIGIDAGLAMPANGQFRSTGNLVNQYEPWKPGVPLSGTTPTGSIDQVAGTLSFHGRQMGVNLGGEIFLKVRRYRIGIHASRYTRNNLRGSLSSTTPSALSGLTRTFTTIQMSNRMDVSKIGTSTPYIGAGLGGFKLKEQIVNQPYFAQKGVMIEGIVGVSSAVGQATSLFTELKLNIAELDEVTGRKDPAIAMLGLSIGIRFGG